MMKVKVIKKVSVVAQPGSVLEVNEAQLARLGDRVEIVDKKKKKSE